MYIYCCSNYYHMNFLTCNDIVHRVHVNDIAAYAFTQYFFHTKMFHQKIEWLLVTSLCSVLSTGSVPNEALWQKSANPKGSNITVQYSTYWCEGGSSYFPMLEELLPWGSLSPNWTSRINTWMSPQSSAALVLHCARLLVSYKCNRGHITMLPAWKHVFSFPLIESHADWWD